MSGVDATPSGSPRHTAQTLATVFREGDETVAIKSKGEGLSCPDQYAAFLLGVDDIDTLGLGLPCRSPNCLSVRSMNASADSLGIRTSVLRLPGSGLARTIWS